MAHDRIKSDAHGPEFLALSMCDMRHVEGGRCWDGPLGDRRECPTKPSPGGLPKMLEVFENGKVV